MFEPRSFTSALAALLACATLSCATAQEPRTDLTVVVGTNAPSADQLRLVVQLGGGAPFTSSSVAGDGAQLAGTFTPPAGERLDVTVRAEALDAAGGVMLYREIATSFVLGSQRVLCVRLDRSCSGCMDADCAIRLERDPGGCDPELRPGDALEIRVSGASELCPQTGTLPEVCEEGAEDPIHDEDLDGMVDEGCHDCPSADQHWCGDMCVDQDVTHCGEGCEPCPTTAVAECTDDGTGTYACTWDACVDGFAECDGNAATACESPLNDAANCGACGVRCGAGYACVDDRCEDDVEEIAAGGNVTCFRTVIGDVFCFGDNRLGQLAQPDTMDESSEPLQVALPGPACAITVGADHVCALVSADCAAPAPVYCWGSNAAWQIDDVGPIVRVPELTGPSSGVVAVEAGTDVTCTRSADDTVQCWGAAPLTLPYVPPVPWPETVDFFAVLGGPGAPNLTFDSVRAESSPLHHASVISAGHAFACSLDSAGAAKCWGINNHCQLHIHCLAGYDDEATPMPVGLASGLELLSSGRRHTCAARAGNVLCWGDNSSAQGPTGTRANEVERSDDFPRVVGLAAGDTHTCVLAERDAAPGEAARRVECWGRNEEYELGSVTTCSLPDEDEICRLPIPTGPIPGAILAIAAGDRHTCALTHDGGHNAIHCWGDGNHRQNGALGPQVDPQLLPWPLGS